MSRLARLEERDRRRMNLKLLWLSQFINTAGLMMLVPIMPLYMEQLGAGARTGLWAGAAVAAPALPLALVTPLWGRLGDRIGHKWMVVRALLGLAAAMGIMAIADTPVVFLLARLLQGAVGGVVEAATAFVSDDGDDHERGSALGRSYSATAAGALTGPLVGGALLATGQLPAFMAALAVAATTLALFCIIALKERTREPRPTPSSSERMDRRRGWSRAPHGNYAPWSWPHPSSPTSASTASYRSTPSTSQDSSQSPPPPALGSVGFTRSCGPEPSSAHSGGAR